MLKESRKFLDSPKFLSICLWFSGCLFCTLFVHNVVFTAGAAGDVLVENVELLAVSCIFFLTGFGVWKLKKWALFCLIITFVVSFLFIVHEIVSSKNLFLVFVVCFYGPLGVRAIIRIWHLAADEGRRQ